MRLWPARARPLPVSRDAPDEAMLVRAARRGDDESFALLVERHQDAIYRLTLRMVGPDAAEDVAQQSFVKAWQGLARFEGEAAFGTWLYRIAVNLCLDHRRSTSRCRAAPLDETSYLVAGAGDVADTVIAELEQAERRRALAWALERLPSEDRLILHLRVGEERSYEEIAAVLGINQRTVGTRLYRARARLHALVAEAPLEASDAVR